MMYKTHLTTGLAAAIAISRPNDVKTLAICAIGAAIGGTISDIDVGSSKPRKEFNTIVKIFLGIFFIFIMLDNILELGLFDYLGQKINILRIVIGILMFIVFGIMGTKTKHRTYTHSILGLVCFGGSVFIMAPTMAIPFVVAMSMHILLDTLNTKKVKILYPYTKRGLAFKLCKADSKADKTIFSITIIALAVEIIFIILKIFKLM